MSSKLHAQIEIRHVINYYKGRVVQKVVIHWYGT